MPKRLHSDQGMTFRSKLVKQLCRMTGISQSQTTPYHPQGNGQCERFNRTLLSMLGTLEEEEKRDWKSYVAPLVHAYNATRNESTGYSPFYLMYRREPRLPVDLAFGIESDNSREALHSYVESMRRRLKDSYTIALTRGNAAKARQKTGYDVRIRGAFVRDGDRVLVKTVAFEGKHKLADKWEEEIYVVLDQPNPDMPVYVVQKEDCGGRKRTLHRNLLLPVGSLATDTDDRNDDTFTPRQTPTAAPRLTRRSVKELRRASQAKPEDTMEVSSIANSDDSDTELFVSVPSMPAVGDAQAGATDTAAEQPVNDHQSTMVPAEEDADSVIDRTNREDVDALGEQEEDTAGVESPTIPRRSGRVRRPHKKFTSGDYVMTAGTAPDLSWMRKVDYLRSVVSGDILAPGAERILEAVLSVIQTST
ncbi:uncharacterized protein LOC117319196 [Pecten maximus]|uniref:uncharacterized protein LOC117319196 n=1 Tax=Pecten maximus TaxID=6579 RepID=UPI001458E8C2|nr:uncharacterized protein LOC117319196 [Pecten maximus]